MNKTMYGGSTGSTGYTGLIGITGVTGYTGVAGPPGATVVWKSIHNWKTKSRKFYLYFSRKRPEQCIIEECYI